MVPDTCGLVVNPKFLKRGCGFECSLYIIFYAVLWVGSECQLGG
jgi:hypothetical protein